MLDVVSIGSALIDIFIHSDQFSLKNGEQGVLLCQRLGDKVNVDGFLLRTGGGGSNTAVGFARMGFQTGLITELGKDTWSKIILDELHDEYVAANYVVEEKLEDTGGSVILVSGNGERTVLVHRGASSMLDPHDIPTDRLGMARWVHLSSIAGQEKTLHTIFETLRDSRAELSWNPGGSEIELLISGALPVNEVPARVLIVNEEEWQQLENRQHEFKEQVPEIIVTRGAEGGLIIFKGEETPFKSLRNESVDDTGAGDAFAVGYVSAVLYGKEPQVAVRWGVQNAHSVIKQVGAKPGLLKKTHLEIQ